MRLGRWKHELMQILKALVLVLTIILLMASVALILIGGTQYLKEIYVHTVLMLAGNVMFYTLAIILADGFLSRSKKKAKVESDESDHIMQCSAGDFIMLIICIFVFMLGLGMIIMGWKEFASAILQGRFLEQLLIIMLFGFIAVIMLLKVSLTKVIYSRYCVKVMRPLRKNVTFQWAELQAVDCCYKKVRNHPQQWMLLTLTMRDQRILLSQQVFQDGWDDFLEELLEQTQMRGIDFSM